MSLFARLAAVLLVGFCLATPTLAADDGKTTLVVNLTSDDVWTAQMALTLATRVKENVAEGEVVVFLNVRGVTLANTKVPQHTGALSGKTPQEMLSAFMKAGGRVFVCGPCTTQAGLSIDERLEGTEVGGPPLVAIMMAPGTRIISY